MFVLVLPPAAGDELQGLKRGIIELADLILVNKADGALLDHAKRSAAEYSNAMHLIRPAHAEWQVAVRAVSALTGSGIDAVWDDVARFRAALEATGSWQRRRAEQARAALWQEIGDGLARPLPRRTRGRRPPRRRRSGGQRRHPHPGRRRPPAARDLSRRPAAVTALRATPAPHPDPRPPAHGRGNCLPTPSRPPDTAENAAATRLSKRQRGEGLG